MRNGGNFDGIDCSSSYLSKSATVNPQPARITHLPVERKLKFHHSDLIVSPGRNIMDSVNWPLVCDIEVELEW
jgi:hypothetical protein